MMTLVFKQWRGLWKEFKFISLPKSLLIWVFGRSFLVQMALKSF